MKQTSAVCEHTGQSWSKIVRREQRDIKEAIREKIQRLESECTVQKTNFVVSLWYEIQLKALEVRKVTAPTCQSNYFLSYAKL